MNNHEQRIGALAVIRAALPLKPEPGVLAAFKLLNKTVKDHNLMGDELQKLNRKIESQRKRLAVLEDSGEKIPCAVCGMNSCRGIFKVEACPEYSNGGFSMCSVTTP
mgnify:CR=1 FL=1